MSREIKCRVWNNISKEFTYYENPIISLDNKRGYPLEFPRKDIVPQPKAMLGGYGDLEWFTGLLDKSGKEIYEGDIICYSVVDCAYIGKPPTEIHIVEYGKYGLKDSPCGLFKVFSKYQPEIIGTIHDKAEE